MLRRCASPVLAVPGVVSPLNRALLAYDGSPKADEALFVSTYLAGRWKVDLTVVTVLTGEQTSAKTIRRARRYLERHGIEAKYVTERGPVGEAILQAAEEHGSELMVMGGYSSPVLEIVFGSTVDEMLRDGRCSVLICR